MSDIDKERIKSCIALGMHLRTIHFSLIVIAFTLLFATVLSKPHTLVRAQQDLALVAAASEKLRNAWLTEYSEKYLLDRAEGIHLDGNPIYVYVQNFQGQGDVVFEGYPEDIWSLPTGRLQRDDSVGQTIGHFVEVWNQLATSFQAEVPGDLAQYAHVKDYDELDGEFENEFEQSSRGSYRGLVDSVNQFSSAKLVKLHDKEIGFRLRALRWSDNARKNVGIPTLGYGLAYTAWGDQISIAIPIAVEQVPIYGIQTALLDNQRRNVEQKSFDEVFPELYRYTEMLRERTFAEVEIYLDGLIDVSENSVQFVGVGLGAGNIRRYGPIALLIVQFYLLLHLRQLRRRFSDIVMRAEIPWIGMYEDRLSRGSFIATVAIFPVTVSIMLVSVFGIDPYSISIGMLSAGVAISSVIAWYRLPNE